MDKVDFSDLVGDKRNILILIAKFPEVFKNAVDNLRLEDLVAFLRELSDIFNSWYDKERVLQEQDPRKRMLRLYIVKGVSVVLKNGLSVLGIRSLERM